MVEFCAYLGLTPLGDGGEHKTARPSPAASNVNQHGIIQIEFPNARVSVPGNADAATVRAVVLRKNPAGTSCGVVPSILVMQAAEDPLGDHT
jgi:hypothetical protein